MELKKYLQEELVQAIAASGAQGATILEIERKVTFERHTVSKYLIHLENKGVLSHRDVGKAKLWFINRAPIQTVLSSSSPDKSFAEKILSNMIETLPYGLTVIDGQYTILFVNEYLKNKYGPVEGKIFFREFLGKDNPLSLKELRLVVESKSGHAHFEITDRHGKVLAIKANTLTLPDHSLAIILLVEDITSRVHAEQKILEQKNMLEAERRALNSAAIVAETDIKGRITYVNDQFVKISGYSEKELLGNDHRIVNSGYHPKPFFREMWKTISSGKVWHGEIKNKAKDGHFYWVDSVITPVLGKNGRPVKYLSIRFDITKQKMKSKK